MTCNEGYEIEGNAELTCQGTSQWDSKEPKCVGTYLVIFCLFILGCHLLWHAVTSEKLPILISGEAKIGMRICLWMFYIGFRRWGGAKGFINGESGQIIIEVHRRTLIAKRCIWWVLRHCHTMCCKKHASCKSILMSEYEQSGVWVIILKLQMTSRQGLRYVSQALWVLSRDLAVVTFAELPVGNKRQVRHPARLSQDSEVTPAVQGYVSICYCSRSKGL